MATNQGLKRLRLCKFPLLLVALIAVGMVIRVPLSPMIATASPEKANRKVAQQAPNAGKQEKMNAKRKSSQSKPNKQKAVNTTTAASVTPRAVATEPSETERPLVEEVPADLPSLVSTGSDWSEVLSRSPASGDDTTRTPLDNVDVGPVSPDNTTPTVEPTETKVEPAPVEPAVSEPEYAAAASPTDTATIVLRNPTGSGGPIQFLIGSERKLLEPGGELKLPIGETYRLRFHRGGTFGYVDQQLAEPGLFEFVPTPQGWKIR